MLEVTWLALTNQSATSTIGRSWIENRTTLASVTRLGALLHFGQLFKACGNNYFVQIVSHYEAIFVKVSKSFIFLVKSFLGNFYRHLATFYWSHWVSDLAKISTIYFNENVNWLMILKYKADLFGDTNKNAIESNIHH